MNDLDEGRVVRLEAAQEALARHFVGWQCRLRQLAVREAEGRPTAGMRPKLSLREDGPSVEINTLLIHRDPSVMTPEFRHMVRKTQDPAERLKNALKLLAAAYYQHPEDFSDELTALFRPDSDIAGQVLQAERCILEFEQYNQNYRLPCDVQRLTEPDPRYQVTFWHNSLFNPRIPAGAQILAFKPDWALAEADPMPEH